MSIFTKYSLVTSLAILAFSVSNPLIADAAPLPFTLSPRNIVGLGGPYSDGIVAKVGAVASVGEEPQMWNGGVLQLRKRCGDAYTGSGGSANGGSVTRTQDGLVNLNVLNIGSDNGGNGGDASSGNAKANGDCQPDSDFGVPAFAAVETVPAAPTPTVVSIADVSSVLPAPTSVVAQSSVITAWTADLLSLTATLAINDVTSTAASLSTTIASVAAEAFSAPATSTVLAPAALTPSPRITASPVAVSPPASSITAHSAPSNGPAPQSSNSNAYSGSGGSANGGDVTNSQSGLINVNALNVGSQNGGNGGNGSSGSSRASCQRRKRRSLEADEILITAGAVVDGKKIGRF